MNLLISIGEDGKPLKMTEDELHVTGTVADYDDGSTQHGVMVSFDHGAAQVYMSDDEAIDLATKIVNATPE